MPGMRVFGCGLIRLAGALALSALMAPAAHAQAEAQLTPGGTVPGPVELAPFNPSEKATPIPLPRLPEPVAGHVVTPLPAANASSDQGPAAQQTLDQQPTDWRSPGEVSPGQPVGKVALRNDIVAVDILGRTDTELHVRLHYVVDSGLKRPVYAGAWLFGPGRKDVGVGYKPATTPAADKGTVDVVLTLPDRQFETAFLEAMLIHDSAVIAQKRFAAAYVWNASAPAPAPAPAPTPTSLIAVGQLQGAWRANLFGREIEYIFTADSKAMNDPRRFQWRAAALQETAKGEILTGREKDQIRVRWRGAAGAGSSTGRVTLDAAGQAVRINWANGVVMTRNPN